MDVLGDSSSDEDEGGSGPGSGRSRRNGGFQGRLVGIKAAKMQRQEDLQMEAQVEASTNALQKLTDAQHERTAFCFLDSILMRHFPEAARYRLAITRKMLERAGLESSSIIDFGGSEGTDDSIGGVGNGVAGLDVHSPMETPLTAAGPAAGARAPPAPGALEGADGASASALAAASAAKSAAARVCQQYKTAAGRRSMETKRQAAAAQLARTPATNRPFDDESESTENDDDSL